MTRTLLLLMAMLGAAAQAAEPVTIRVGLASASSDVGFFIADKKGYFKQEGLNVSFLNFDSGAKMVAPLGNGQLEVGAGSPAAGLYNAIARGIDMKIAGSATGSASTSTLNEALKKAGLKTGDVERVFLAFPQHVMALQNKAVDAAMTTEPSATRAVQSGAAVRVLGDDAIYPNHQLAVVLYGGDFAKRRPEVARRFMRAYLK